MSDESGGPSRLAGVGAAGLIGAEVYEEATARPPETTAGEYDPATLAEFAREGKPRQANDHLSTVVERLDTVVSFLQDGEKFSEAVVELLVERAEHAKEKANAARR